MIPIPQDGGPAADDDDPLAQLKLDMAAARGRTILSETTAAAWGKGAMEAPRADWKSQRFGANPPVVLQGLRSDAALGVLTACGVPASLATDADGTSQREAWRRFVLGSVEPLLRGALAEFSGKLNVTISADLRGLWAHDLAGRSAAFGKLVSGGVDPATALALAGVVADGDA